MSTAKMIFSGQLSKKYQRDKYISKTDDIVTDMDDRQARYEPLSDFGKRLRSLRRRAGMSQEALSIAISNAIKGKDTYTQSYISNLESSMASYLPSVQALRAIAIALDTSTDYLLGLTNDDLPHGNLDDQVVVTVEDPQEKAMIQEAMKALANASPDDKQYITALIRRLLPKSPRIIGGNE